MSTPFQIKIEENRVLRGNLYPSRNQSRGTLIVCHGFKGFKDWGMFPYIGETLAEDLDVITFNFSFNGVGEQHLDFTELDKFAQNTYARELEDIDVVVKAVQMKKLPIDKHMNGDQLFLLGHSRGAGVSLIYSFDHPETVKGVISWNGITNVDLFTKEQKEEMKQKGISYVYNGRTKQQMPLNVEILEDIQKNSEKYHILERVKSTQTPVVLIQGTKDHDRLIRGSKQLVENNPDIDWIHIPEGNHTFNAVHPFQGTTEPLEQAIHETKKFIYFILK
ncbi:alpha/beta hydrolase family protein [Chengkuizengella axinellae]|uniref:Alpha/beta fold hydrolase n=1 Tax=Chengkuizengella axinellae TaxID=3064388 RepID=A0ABT9IV19_9BACL|nr:alpha/beta fold hydrolase [Chengkuizengella sp. 2205SS18-9]MDP5273196.1 alpha/beta fold hydrolase [Chengkuizengella sp. 2205SS18-9]